MSDTHDFREFFAGFVRRHLDPTPDPMMGEIKLNATPYQLMVLGEFLAQGMASWALGVEPARERRLLLEAVPAEVAPAQSEGEETGDRIEDLTISISWKTRGGAA